MPNDFAKPWLDPHPVAREAWLSNGHGYEWQPGYPERIIRDLWAALDEARAEVERVTRERDAGRAQITDLLPEADAAAFMLTQVGRERDALKARIERLEKALIDAAHSLRAASDSANKDGRQTERWAFCDAEKRAADVAYGVGDPIRQDEEPTP